MPKTTTPRPKPRALVHSESSRGKPVYGHIGDRRWECEWYELTPGGKARRASDPDYEHDHDRDEVTLCTAFPTKEAAIAAGAIAAPGSVYGCAIVQEHELQWFVLEDGVAEWEPIGNQYEVDATGDVTEI